MENFRVESADMDVIVEAEDHKMAAVLAINKNKPSQLGFLVRVLKEGDPNIYAVFFETVFILKIMGIDWEVE